MSSKKSTSSLELSQEFAGEVISFRKALYESMNHVLENFPQAFIMGQGVDDHKGIFGTTSGFAEKYGADRAFDTPLAEEGMTGVAIGASLGGLYPIHTHIRVDFALLAMNQLINLAAKYKYMSGGKCEVPMLVRMIIGRSWGQGSQHSQSLQSLFGHIPGLTVIMPASAQTILESYPYFVSEHKGPVISIEHRLLYDIDFRVSDIPRQREASPLTSYLVRPGKDVTIVATSIMVLEALRSADYVKKNAGIDCEVIDLNCISHPDKKLITDSVKKTGKLIVADTSWQAYGVCAEVCRIISETCPTSLRAPVITMGMAPAPCPTAKNLEDLFYPNERGLVDEICKLVTGREEHGVVLPEDQSTVESYKTFKGPF